MIHVRSEDNRMRGICGREIQHVAYVDSVHLLNTVESYGGERVGGC